MTHGGRAIRLVAVGDLQLGDSATCVGFGFRSRVPGRVLGAALGRFTAAMGPVDLAFANLETPLSDIGFDRRRRRARQLRGDPNYAAMLHSAGFTVLNVANNHALEHGPEAFRDSVSRLESLGIAVCGQKGSGGWVARPSTRMVMGVRVGFLGYSLRPGQDETGSRLHAEATSAQILADVARLRSEADCVVVSLHWGEEFAQVPSASEVAVAHAIVDAGAAVILGHHPHVARPVERYRGGIIAYSLGNFAGDMIWYPPLRRGLVLDCRLTADGVEDARVYDTFVGRSFLPRRDDRPLVPVSEQVVGLAEGDYISLARSTVRAQRRALYFYTLRNAWRFDPRVLGELAATTLRGKVSRAKRGDRDEIWG